MTSAAPLTTAFAGKIGVARVDITPPLAINARNWGAATHDVATAVHRPLTATALVLSRNADSPPLVLLAVDLGWWKSREDEWLVRGGVLDALQLEEARLLLSLSHTHAGPNLYSEDADRPGGEHIRPYLLALRDRLVAVVRAALDARVPARLAWRTGRCNLAQNRDLPDPAKLRHVVGWNPDAIADDTLLVGRVEHADSGRVLATLVNYACHPTTLAADNRLLSPDFPGAMRETVEAASGAPCLFLQGASGDLGTAAQFGADPAVADRLGRQLGYATLAVLESWPDALREIDRVVESGAPLGLTREVAALSSPILLARTASVAFALKPLDSLAQIEQELAKTTDRAFRERLRRKRAIRRIVGDGEKVLVPLWLWRIGPALLVAQPNEAYSQLQLELRRRFSPHPVVVLNVTNGYAGYLPPRDHYNRDQYSVWQTPFAAGALEQLIATASTGLAGLAKSGE